MAKSQLWADSDWATSFPLLVNFARELLVGGITPGSRKTYGTGQRSFLRICAALGRSQPLPARDLDILMWVSHLAAKDIKYTSIRNYLSGVASMHRDLGLPFNCLNNPQLHRLIVGIRKFQGGTAILRPRTFDTARSPALSH